MERFTRWLSKHLKPGACEWCDYKHEGYKDYRNHMEAKHPKENAEFKAWAGLR